MVVKSSSGVYEKVGSQDTFDVIPGNDLKLRLNNVTDTDATRFRCTFLSSFAAPKSVIQVEIKGEVTITCMSFNYNVPSELSTVALVKSDHFSPRPSPSPKRC